MSSRQKAKVRIKKLRLGNYTILLCKSSHVIVFVSFHRLPEPDPPNRVELIPILWYDRIHASTNSLMTSIQATTLNTIPALRAIANDVILDVLMYLTPNFCYDTLAIARSAGIVFNVVA